jgi:hypothetical protein
MTLMKEDADRLLTMIRDMNAQSKFFNIAQAILSQILYSTEYLKTNCKES